MSAFAQPVVAFRNGATHLPKRIPLNLGGTDAFNERWLQAMLFASPDALPIREIVPYIEELIPVCMEIETGAGPADILYVTPAGQVVLVETKLWRNPEARREVVGQILDYAKHLTGWTYDTLDQRAATAAKSMRGHLLRCVRTRLPDVDEAAFVDSLNRSLSSGDFVLLIVGDGIRYGAESLVAFLERFGNLKFRLGLVEVAAFELHDGSTLLQPRILAKTEIIERTVLMGATGPVAFEDAAMAEDAASERGPDQRECFSTFWRDFVAKLGDIDPDLMPLEPARYTNQFIQMPPGGGKAWVSAFLAKAASHGGVYLSFSGAYDRTTEMIEMLQSDLVALERELGYSLTFSRNGDRAYVSAPKAPFTNLDMPEERQKVMAYLADTTARMVRALRPRLEAANRVMP